MAESMKDFETELEQSFQVIKEGDVLEVEVIGISETELTVDLNYYTEGIIPLEEFRRWALMRRMRMVL